MPSKKAQIRDYDSTVPAKQIADELGTSPGYVYKVRSETRRKSPDTAENPAGDVTGMDTDIATETPASGPETDLDMDENPLADLLIEDEYDEYECECGAPLEYLQDECSECGAEPAWWKA